MRLPKIFPLVLATFFAMPLAAQSQPPAAATAAAQQVAVTSPAGQSSGDYVIGRQDVLNIALFEQPELNGKYVVDTDGYFTFPLVGKVSASGLTLRQVELALRKQLTDGFFKDPHLSVTLDQFRGRRVFVFGGVTSPGMYPLAEGMTLIEILAKSGGGTASEAVIVRTPGATGPIMPTESATSEVIRVSVREFEKEIEEGVLNRNVILQDGDTVFVPRVDPNRVFVTGEVKNPGAFSVPDGTTVLQLLSLAGGVTEGASTGRVRIIRIVDGEKKTIRVKLQDTVKPGDTVVVPTRIF